VSLRRYCRSFGSILAAMLLPQLPLDLGNDALP